MKFSMMMSVLAVALAVATTGCRYDKSGKGAGAGAGAGASDIGGSAINGSDVSANSEIETDEFDVKSLGGKGNFEDLYKKCTDVEFAPVYFGFDSSVVPSGEQSKIEEVVRHLTERTERVVVVEGNCDERGSNEYNLSLGETRAITLRNYLVQGGISADRIQTRSYGEDKPAVEGHDESAYSQNRRGEFVIFTTK